jgi:hypothetical protein
MTTLIQPSYDLGNAIKLVIQRGQLDQVRAVIKNGKGDILVRGPVANESAAFESALAVLKDFYAQAAAKYALFSAQSKAGAFKQLVDIVSSEILKDTDDYDMLLENVAGYLCSNGADKLADKLNDLMDGLNEEDDESDDEAYAVTEDYS